MKRTAPKAVDKNYSECAYYKYSINWQVFLPQAFLSLYM